MPTDPTQITLTGWQGTAIPLGGTVWDVNPVYDAAGALISAGTPYDISGWVFMLTIKKNYSDSDDMAVFKKDWTVAVGTNGEWSSEVPDTITQNMSPGSFVWDIHVIEPGQEPRFFLGGSIVVPKGVTKRIAPSL